MRERERETVRDNKTDERDKRTRSNWFIDLGLVSKISRDFAPVRAIVCDERIGLEKTQFRASGLYPESENSGLFGKLELMKTGLKSQVNEPPVPYNTSTTLQIKVYRAIYTQSLANPV